MIVKMHSVFCDRCPWWVAERRTTAEARAEAKRAGWVRRQGEDLCPACAAAGEMHDPHGWVVE